MEILYLKSRCEFMFCGWLVVLRDLIVYFVWEYYVFLEYKLWGLDVGIMIYIGYVVDEILKKCGFYIYNKNRLIRMY